jgi:hypothetical protein
LGLCFNISGSVNCICARALLHCYTYLFSVSCVCACCLPLLRTACLYLARASLHCALNHGARCLAHLFGFREVRLVMTVTTPAATASSSKNSSIFAVRRSLSSMCSCTMRWNASVNFCVEVCCFHFFALVLYSSRHSPSIHLYDRLLLRYSDYFSGAVFLGWPTHCFACGPSVEDGDESAPQVGCPAGGGVRPALGIGSVVDSKS